MTRMRIDSTEISDANIFETLLDNFPDMIHSIDQDGQIVYTNKTAERLLGYTVQELLTMNIRQIYAEEVLKDVEKGFSDLKQKGDKTVESLLKTKKGISIPVEIRSFGIYDDAGRFIRTFSILRDIRNIKELQQGLVHASRLAAIGELAAGVAHDINNPLTVIMLSFELIMLDIRKATANPGQALENVRTHTANAHKAAQSIQKLSEHLRNFSRGMVEKREIIDLHDVLTDAVFITNNKIMTASVSVNKLPKARQHFVQGCSNQMEQVFVNLIGNACDAMANASVRELGVSISPAKRDDIIYWKCDITDTGGGVPEGLREEIFRSFFTTKEKGKGTGLGLSISRGIVLEHKGFIELTSELNKGSTFSVYLPQASTGQPDG